jgi:hypothetical protein
MTVVLAVVLLVHGSIHFLGFAKAFGFAELPQLVRPIPPSFGALWLMAGLAFLATAGALFVWPRWWWAIGAGAIVVSTVAIAPSWADARFGAVGNLIALVSVILGFLAQGPTSLRATYDRDIERALTHVAPAALVSDADLAHLPAPVQRYLRTAGVVGRPRVHNVRVRLHGRIRSGPDSPWIALSAEQYNFFDEPARLFYFTGKMLMVPVQGYHWYIGPSAEMHVKAAALVPVLDVSGREMSQSETVTMFNDMCVMAPATLISPAIVWEPVDAHTARARFTNAGYTIRAELSFNDDGELTDFRSDDRFKASSDGMSGERTRWSTPLKDYRSFGSVRLASVGEGRWHEAGGEYAYIELAIDDVRYNLSSR